ncbi:unnamed protein product [Wuchereria bancrofti]|uniref:Uncharacterized protein n=2 Tax=Wuchereria bancrofti TaxID=6293 RepID=A0A3P7FLC7_WUCBA|nr:unnamed protein product [Wuchereria bancrofti]
MKRNSANCDSLMFDKDAPSKEAIHKECDSNSASSLFMVTGNRSSANFHSNLDFTSNEFLAFLERMQSQRLDDQRCEMPDVHVSPFSFFLLFFQNKKFFPFAFFCHTFCKFLEKFLFFFCFLIR